MPNQYWTRAERENLAEEVGDGEASVKLNSDELRRILAAVEALVLNEERNVDALEALYVRLPVNKDDSTELLRRATEDRLKQSRAILAALEGAKAPEGK
jgi:hypothetical protein